MVGIDGVTQTRSEESAVGQNDRIWSVCNEKVGRVDCRRNAGKDEVKEGF
jgi:hypothetical protein